MAEILIVRFLMLFGAIGVAYWVYRKISKEIAKTKSEHRLMKRAVELAKSSEGKVTSADLSFELDMPLDSAEHLLQRLVEEGIATADVGDEGSLVYDIPRARQTRPRRELA
jgi:hypothetical protein